MILLWRSKIGFADWVDFLDEKKSTWSRAQIVEENQPEFKFKILREGELDYHAEWVEIFSDRMHLITRKLGLLRKSYENFRNDSRLAMNWMRELTLIALGILGLLLSSGTNDQNVEEVKVKFNSHIVDSWVPRYGSQSAPPYTHTDKK